MASIEEEIKQEKKFATEHERAAVNVMFTGSWLHSSNATWLKKHGITPEQFNVLRILRGSYPKPLMLSSVTCRMIDKNSNATRLVEKLRLKGYVKREQCESNRRQVDILITEKGLNLLTKLDSDGATWMENLKSITKAEAQELNRLLDKLRS